MSEAKRAHPLSENEIAARSDATLKRLLATPPTPHKPKPGTTTLKRRGRPPKDKGAD